MTNRPASPRSYGPKREPLGRGTWLALGLAPAVLFAAHVLYGANGRAPALILSLGGAVLLAGWAASRAGRRALGELGTPVWPLSAFALTLLAAAWSLGPLSPGGALEVWAWSGATGAATLDRSATLVEIVKLAGLGCFAGLGYVQGSRSRAARATLRIVLLIGAVFSLLMLIRFLAGAEHIGQKGRFGAGFLSPNSAGTLFAMLVVLSVGGLVREIAVPADDARRRIVRLTRLSGALALVLLFSGCLLLTASRGALAAAGLATAGLMVWEMVSGRLKIGSGAVVLTGWAGHLIILLGGAGAVLLSRFGGLAGDLEIRRAIFDIHWQMFLASPLTGWGLGAFDAVNQQAMTPGSYPVLWDLRATHNVVLQWLEEAGLIGSAPMFATVVLVLALTLAGLRRRPAGAGRVRALMMVNAVVLLHGMTDFALQVPSLSAFWAFLLGLQLSMSNPPRVPPQG